MSNNALKCNVTVYWMNRINIQYKPELITHILTSFFWPWMSCVAHVDCGTLCVTQRGFRVCCNHFIMHVFIQVRGNYLAEISVERQIVTPYITWLYILSVLFFLIILCRRNRIQTVVAIRRDSPVALAMMTAMLSLDMPISRFVVPGQVNEVRIYLVELDQWSWGSRIINCTVLKEVTCSNTVRILAVKYPVIWPEFRIVSHVNFAYLMKR